MERRHCFRVQVKCQNAVKASPTTPAMSENKQAMKFTLVADVPADLLMQWLQHVRDFDTANPGCRFEVAIEAPDKLTGEMIEKLREINPELSIEKWGLK